MFDQKNSHIENHKIKVITLATEPLAGRINAVQMTKPRIYISSDKIRIEPNFIMWMWWAHIYAVTYVKH